MFFLLISLVLIIIFSNRSQNIEVDLKFNEDNAYNNIEDQLDIGDRIPASRASRECVEYFISEFQKINPNFTYILHNFTVHSTACQNVLFKLNENHKNIVILSAHYDSRAEATKGDSDKPVPGANDGASGSAVLIELANVFYERKDDLECQIWFVFFDAEDQGKDEGGYGIEDWDWCEGSMEFVDEIDHFYDSKQEEFDCMILLDMVGGEGLQFIKEEYSTSSLLEELFEVGRQLGYSNEFPIVPTSSLVFDDHVAFLEEDISVADLIINFWNNPEWPHHHTTHDDLSHISKRNLKVTGTTIEQFIYNNYLQENDEVYVGNYPWEDNNNVSNQFIIYVFPILLGISVFITFFFLIHRKTLKKREINS